LNASLPYALWATLIPKHSCSNAIVEAPFAFPLEASKIFWILKNPCFKYHTNTSVPCGSSQHGNPIVFKYF